MSDTTPKDPAVIVAVEGGGTSFVVAICHVTSASAHQLPTNIEGLPEIVHRKAFDSSHEDPNKTLKECVEFIQQHKPSPQGYHALGIASFGPLGVNPHQPSTYGKILSSSPKAAWRNVDLLTPLQQACQGTLHLAVKVDTDVNAPAMAEHLLAQSTHPMSSLAYITVGTGIGVGLVVNDQPVHGRMHPEGGHVPIQPLQGDTFGGYSWSETSPFGGVNTVEGIASSVALTERYQKTQGGQQTVSRDVLSTLSDDDQIWDHAANALANLCVTLLLTLSIERIVLGGGISQRQGLLEKIHDRTQKLLNGYLELPPLDTVIMTSPFFGKDAGLMGTIVMAQMALIGTKDKPKKLSEELEQMKRAAFNVGLVHGILVGTVVTAIVCQQCFFRRR